MTATEVHARSTIAYFIEASGLLRKATILEVDGILCDTQGEPLIATEEYQELRGWRFSRARRYTCGPHSYLVKV